MTSTRRNFHEELDQLVGEVVKLGELAEEAIVNGAQALISDDLVAAERVIEGDQAIDGLMSFIEVRAFDLLARQQPTAVDLRVLITIMREVREIERAGDNVVNVVKGVRRLHPYVFEPELTDLIERMRDQTVLQLRTAVTAFAEKDIAKSAALADMDDVMDDLQKELFAWLFNHHAESEAIQRVVQLALIGRYFERIGDHAVNLAERVPFMVTGQVELS